MKTPVQSGASKLGASTVVKTGSTATGSTPLGNAMSALGITSADIAAFTQSSGGTTAGGPSGVTTKTTYTPAGATPDINTIWRSYTGKDASKKQINAVTAAINAAMAASPSKTTNTGGDYSTTSKIVGADAQQIIKEQALQDPATAPFQAATTYYDDLLNVLQGPVGRGY
jgi:hypothetical protein